ncbi:MAG: OadG family protein [Candidatus Brocadiae bacterium]|nr:OadG family protein [Candidatus Brocadiia bacterium]
MSEELVFAFRITVIAMTVVYISLILVAGIIGLFKKLNKVSMQPAPAHTTEVKVEEKYPHDLPPELLAVISAAVAVAIDKKFQIKKLRYRNAPPENNWSKQGVASIMASHAINKHKPEHHK